MRVRSRCGCCGVEQEKTEKQLGAEKIPEDLRALFMFYDDAHLYGPSETHPPSHSKSTELR